MTTTDTTTNTATVEPQPAVTDGTTTVETESTQTAEASGEDDSEVAEDQDDHAGPGREAARYRRRLREAEAERDTLKATVESLQRAEVERQATADGLRPAALWAGGAELAGLLGDDGAVDGSKVSAAVAAAREQLGIPKPAHNTREGRHVGRPAGKPTGRDAMVATVMGRNVAGDE
jgi:hypothetical protein